MSSFYAICPSCNRPSQMVFTGEQEGFEDLPSVSLYNCQACGSTVSLRSIQRLQHQPHIAPLAKGARL